MEESMPDSDQQALHYLIHDADWDHAGVMNDVAKSVDAALGGSRRTCLLIDESAFAKKGKHSAGVARQWNGRLGKTDNCQVGVFSALCRDEFCVPVSCDLYLPKEWTKSKSRMKKAHIPTDKQALRSKVEIAIEQIDNALAQGLRFEWIAVDGGYGKDGRFHRNAIEKGLTYFADVHKDQQVLIEQPVDVAMSSSGSEVREAAPMRVDKWLEKSENIPWEYLTVREGTKGQLKVRCKRCSVWLWNRNNDDIFPVTLLISQTQDGKDTKYGITNADTDKPTKDIAYYQRQRFWIEQSFKDGKSQVGMNEYQVRSWHGWHRHMAFCAMALLFMLEMRLTNKDALPLISAHDARNILAREFIQNYIDGPDDQFATIIYKRHRRRMADIHNSYKKNGLEIPERYMGK
jgi:SRSO17 transposase